MNIADLAHQLRTRRRTLNLDQKGLAEIAGVSVHALSDIESGKGNPTLEILNRLANALGMEVTMRVQARDQSPEVTS
jgi:transcriptional regulator with XRE-family HTH domain